MYTGEELAHSRDINLQSSYRDVHLSLNLCFPYRLSFLPVMGTYGDLLRCRHLPQLIPSQSILTPISLQNFTYDHKTQHFLPIMQAG